MIPTIDLSGNVSASLSVERRYDLEAGKIYVNNKFRKSAMDITDQINNTLVNYHGTNIFQAASQGNLPLCVLLWGIASAKKVKLMTCDVNGNNPMHFASLAESPEVGCYFVDDCLSIVISYNITLSVDRLLDFYYSRPKVTRILVFD
jgi:hypothetical protein